MKVYWSRCGHGHGNFGDKITPLLLKHVGVAVEWSPPEHAELIGVGSILEKAPTQFRGTIWTTGFMHASSRGDFPRARVLGLRGKLTLQHVGHTGQKVALGDAGLLCDELVPSVKKKHKLGIIPHFVDVHDPFVHALADGSAEARVIDICAEPRALLRSVAECENIISSSLHGLILADSLRIPNRWMELNRGAEVVTGARFKFHDYYSAFGIELTPLALDASATLDKVLNAIDPTEKPGLESIRMDLRGTLMAIRNEIRSPSAEEIEAKAHAIEDWNRRAAELRGLVSEIIPHGAAVLVADDEQIRSTLTNVQTIPFTERDGEYWGPPATAAQAIAAIEEALRGGATWVIIAWPMAWTLERFPELARYLGDRMQKVHTSAVGSFFTCP
jgi:pyruvyltransferase